MIIYLFTHENGLHFFYDTVKKLVHATTDYEKQHNVYDLQTGRFYSSSEIKLIIPEQLIFVSNELTNECGGNRKYIQNFIEKIILDKI